MPRIDTIDQGSDEEQDGELVRRISGSGQGTGHGVCVHETPNSDACTDERPELNASDVNASVLHSLTPYFPFLSTFTSKKISHAAPEAALAPTEEGINSWRSRYRSEL